MIPLAEWSRKRPARGFFSNGMLSEFDDSAESSAADFDAIVEGLLDVSMLNVRCDEANIQQAKAGNLVHEFAGRLRATVETFSSTTRTVWSETFNAILRPWLGMQISQSAVEDFCNAIAVALGKDVAKNLVAEVPDAFQEAVKQKLADLEIPVITQLV